MWLVLYGQFEIKRVNSKTVKNLHEDNSTPFISTFGGDNDIVNAKSPSNLTKTIDYSDSPQRNTITFKNTNFIGE